MAGTFPSSYPIPCLFGNGSPVVSFDFTKGSGVDRRLAVVPTFTRATASTVYDWEGAERNILIGEFPFNGLRRVRNLLATTSQDLSNVAWTKSNATVATGVSDPVGGTSACTVTATAINGSVFQQPASTATAMRVSGWVRRRTGVGSIFMRTPDNADFDITAQVTSAWQRISPPVAASSAGVGTCLYKFGTNGDAIDIAFSELEDITGQSNQNPGEYVSVGVLASPFQGAYVDGVQYFAWQNGNTVASNVVTQAQGAALPNGSLWPAGYQPQVASTNLVLQSENFGTTWAAVGTPTQTPASVNVGSLVLSLLGDADAGTLDGYTQTITFTGNAVKAVSVFVSKGTATSSVIRLRDTTGAADRLLAAITWTGSVPTVTMTTGTLIRAWQLINNVYRIELLTTAVTAANTNSLQVYPATDAALSVGLTGNINVGGVMAEDSADRCSSYIPTTITTITRNADVESAPVGSWYNASAGTIVAVFVRGAGVASNQLAAEFDDGTGNNVIATYLAAASNLGTESVVTGGVSQALIAGAALPASTAGKVGTTWASNDFAVYVNGVAGGTDASGTVPTVTTFWIGQAFNGAQFNGILQRLDYYSSRLPNTTLQALTT